MSIEIDSIKRKLLVKYPILGSVIANLEFKPDYEIDTAGTDGKQILYHPNFVEKLSTEEQVFLFAHEVCHVAFKHISRSEGKDKRVWNMATDAVINALLKKDGLPIIEGGVDIPEAIDYDAERMYEKLLKEKEQNKQEEQNQNSQENEGQDSDRQTSTEDSKTKQNKVGHDIHDLWEKAIEEQKQNKQGEQGQEKSDENNFAQKGETETFKQNRIERNKQLQELSEELAKQSSHKAGNEIQREGKQLSDIGIAVPLIDWRKLLKQAVKYNEEWTRKNARMRNGYFRHKVEQVPIRETEILLDTSGSVSEVLLKNFLRECKHILDNSKVKVGCFNTEFHGFTELRKPEEIETMRFPIGGGTDFNPAVHAFSKRVPNKIIFTDGQASMPKEDVRDIIWIVFGDTEIKPRGKVINITGEQLRKLYQYCNRANITQNR